MGTQRVWVIISSRYLWFIYLFIGKKEVFEYYFVWMYHCSYLLLFSLHIMTIMMHIEQDICSFTSCDVEIEEKKWKLMIFSPSKYLFVFCPNIPLLLGWKWYQSTGKPLINTFCVIIVRNKHEEAQNTKINMGRILSRRGLKKVALGLYFVFN